MATATESKRPALIPTSEVEAMLGVSKRTVRLLVRKGTIKPVSIDGLTWWRFRRADIERLIAGEERPDE
jgi:excisionase family DNA binding protein